MSVDLKAKLTAGSIVLLLIAALWAAIYSATTAQALIILLSLASLAFAVFVIFMILYVIFFDYFERKNDESN